ncbi:NAD(P)H-dependent oxidoreductase [Rubritalea profundi]|uniref:NAD(P)H-dependent oxidoreductase n=1 Tax=Rubritalea profundi TaxID=1658618 RepID=A0A2S7U284_9BACT|nr:NAD(P)H-dependent oxidoreductase [Rubritalea profundi]PQJ29108.1 NAD(P)H-dependent oxidoreductase [Rubritalea profundi]
MTPTTLLDALNWRYATKAFDPSRTIASEVWDAIEESLVLTPSSFGLQPWKFIVVTDPDVKKQLLPHSWNQQQVVDCSHLVVLAAHGPIGNAELDTFIDTTHAVRGGEKESLTFYRDMMGGFIANMSAEQLIAWAKNQVYIALGQLMASAAFLKIDACPMEGITPAEYDKILGLEGTGYFTTVACPMGYRSNDDKYASLPKVRYSKDKIIQQR